MPVVRCVYGAIICHQNGEGYVLYVPQKGRDSFDVVVDSFDVVVVDRCNLARVKLPVVLIGQDFALLPCFGVCYGTLQLAAAYIYLYTAIRWVK